MTQRLKALARANEIRAYRKELKADLKAGRAYLADAILSDAPELQTMRVRDLLLATPALGHRKVARALASCRFSSTATLRGVSERRRVELLAYIAVNHSRVELGWEPGQRHGPERRKAVA